MAAAPQAPPDDIVGRVVSALRAPPPAITTAQQANPIAATLQNLLSSARLDLALAHDWLRAIAAFIARDLQARGGAVPEDAAFLNIYGISRSRYYTWRKLIVYPELEALVKACRLSYTDIQNYQPGALDLIHLRDSPHPLQVIIDQCPSDVAVRAALVAESVPMNVIRPPILVPREAAHHPPTIKLRDIKRMVKAKLRERLELADKDIVISEFRQGKDHLYSDVAAAAPYAPEVILFHGTTEAGVAGIKQKGGFDEKKIIGCVDDGGRERYAIYSTGDPCVADRYTHPPEKKVKGHYNHYRFMVVHRELLVPFAGIKINACTGDTWATPPKALVFTEMLFVVKYKWNKNFLFFDNTFPADGRIDNHPNLEAGLPNDRLVFEKWMLRNLIVSRGRVDPPFLARFFRSG